MPEAVPFRAPAIPARPWHVLVFPGGTEIGLEINRALRGCKEVALFAAGQALSQHTDCVFRHVAEVPGVDDPDWLGRLNAALERFAIDFILPAHDDVVLALADRAAEVRARVVGSPAETCRIARSKAHTYAALEGAVPVPARYGAPADVPDAAYPVFVKPDRGNGSRRARRIDSRSALEAALSEEPDLLILEHLAGEEYTVDCFSDRERGLLYCAGRRRVRTRNGIAMHSEDVQDPAFARYANAICARMALHGAWFYQLKRDSEGLLKLLEVGPRIAGTMCLHRVQGVNFPLLSIYEELRIPLAILTHALDVSVDRALINRYRVKLTFETVYVDLDDTLVVGGCINTELMALLYQFLNAGKRLVLLTRHSGDLSTTLQRYRLQHLFDRVVHIRDGSPKSEYIDSGPAIHIDDSFSERREVAERRGIPTFDLSMIEMLRDERV